MNSEFREMISRLREIICEVLDSQSHRKIITTGDVRIDKQKMLTKGNLPRADQLNTTI